MTARKSRTRQRASLESWRGIAARPKNVTFGALRGRGHAPMVPIMENITPSKPAKRALAALDQPAPTDIGPPKRISPKVRAAIDAMVTGECKNITEAGAKVGLARESLSRALSTPHIAEHLRQKVMRHLAIHAARAGATKVELLDSSNEMARDRASTFVLGLAGIQPAASPSLNVNIEVKAGYVIDVSPEPVRTVSPVPMKAID